MILVLISLLSFSIFFIYSTFLLYVCLCLLCCAWLQQHIPVCVSVPCAYYTVTELSVFHLCQLYNNCLYSLLSVCLPYCTISVLHVPTLLWTVKSFLYVGHLISCISWVWQSTNLRSQQKKYSLLLYSVIFLIHKFTWRLTIPSSSNHEISCPWY